MHSSLFCQMENHSPKRVLLIFLLAATTYNYFDYFVVGWFLQPQKKEGTQKIRIMKQWGVDLNCYFFLFLLFWVFHFYFLLFPHCFPSLLLSNTKDFLFFKKKRNSYFCMVDKCMFDCVTFR